MDAATRRAGRRAGGRCDCGSGAAGRGDAPSAVDRRLFRAHTSAAKAVVGARVVGRPGARGRPHGRADDEHRPHDRGDAARRNGRRAGLGASNRAGAAGSTRGRRRRGPGCAPRYRDSAGAGHSPSGLDIARAATKRGTVRDFARRAARRGALDRRGAGPDRLVHRAAARRCRRGAFALAVSSGR